MGTLLQSTLNPKVLNNLRDGLPYPYTDILNNK